MGMKKRKARRKRPGPAPEALRIEGNWKDALKGALQKVKPAEGWPEGERASEG